MARSDTAPVLLKESDITEATDAGRETSRVGKS